MRNSPGMWMRDSHSCGTYRGDQEKGAQGNGSGYVCAYTLSNIQSTIAGNTEEQYRKATSILINSDVKYIFPQEDQPVWENF